MHELSLQPAEPIPAPLNSICSGDTACEVAGDPAKVMVTYRIENRAARPMSLECIARRPLSAFDWFTPREEETAEFESYARAEEVRRVIALSTENPIMKEVIEQSRIVVVKWSHAKSSAMWKACHRVDRTALLVVRIFLEGAPALMAKGGAR